ncbi:DMT family transporter [Metallumcola ferriviriculae]|uniref:DMT family transporter n=1 Tax=Metallumcola ferriviriculae TaxID=3039180 RepID=A0AAU0UKE0_9FIRM|nr:DMT family transporter [Desulfitibacteraceae bacterium MK1]
MSTGQVKIEQNSKMLPGPGPLVWAALLFTVFSWGSSFAVAKYAMNQLTPISLATLRFLLASVFFMPLLASGGRWKQVDAKDVPKMVGLAFLGITSYFWVQYAGVSRTTATNASLLITTAPVFVTILSAVIYREKITLKVFLGIAIAFSGSTLIITGGKSLSLLNHQYLIGNGLMVFNAFCWALFTIAGKQLMKKYDPVLLTGYITIVGTALFIPLAVRDGLPGQLSGIGVDGWAAIVFLGVFCSVGGYLGWNYALSKLSTSTTAVFLYIQPLITALMAALLLNERITFIIILGGILIVYGVLILTRK